MNMLRLLGQRSSMCQRQSLHINHFSLTSRGYRSSPVPRFQHEYQRSGRPNQHKTRDTRLKVAGVVGMFGTVYYISHLEQVPETGRWRFMNTGPKFEAEIGELARAETREELRGKILPIHHPITRHVRRVASQILQAANLGVLRDDVPHVIPAIVTSEDEFWNPDSEIKVTEIAGPAKEWDVIVVNDPKVVNAQAVPGLVVVYTGILPICRDEEGLAAVLSHEIGHVVARHTAERISSQTVFLWLLTIFQLLGIDLGLSNLLQTFLLELPNSRTQEREADMIGLGLMANACYDPKAAPEMFSRLGKVESASKSNGRLDFMRTHPASANRVKYLEELLPKAYALRAANPSCAGIEEAIQGFNEAFGSLPSPTARRLI